jgi:hypothetical protein
VNRFSGARLNVQNGAGKVRVVDQEVEGVEEKETEVLKLQLKLEKVITTSFRDSSDLSSDQSGEEVLAGEEPKLGTIRSEQAFLSEWKIGSPHFMCKANHFGIKSSRPSPAAMSGRGKRLTTPRPDLASAPHRAYWSGAECSSSGWKIGEDGDWRGPANRQNSPAPEVG